MNTPEITALLQQLRTLMGNNQLPDQRSVEDQRADLIYIAHRLGLYDIADLIKPPKITPWDKTK